MLRVLPTVVFFFLKRDLSFNCCFSSKCDQNKKNLIESVLKTFFESLEHSFRKSFYNSQDLSKTDLSPCEWIRNVSTYAQAKKNRSFIKADKNQYKLRKLALRVSFFILLVKPININRLTFSNYMDYIQ